MSFFSLTFSALFLGIFLLWWLLPQRLRPFLLAAANLCFAGLLGLRVLLCLLLISLIGYCFGHLMKGHKWILWLGTAALLTPLILYKYLPFLAGLFQWASPFSQLLAPLGLSFYTFKSVSYLIEVYRGNLSAVKNPVDYFAYIGFFPQLPMGPIQRPAPFFDAMKSQQRYLDYHAACNAGMRIMWALFLKKCLADPLTGFLGALAPDYFGYSLSIVWSLMAYSLYLYFDFAAYSNMAIGFGELLGLPCAENFKSPYFSRSLGEFWRRWHISLSYFLRDYVYIPLGGSRNGTAVLALATMTTFVLSGVWHGSTSGFLLWGALHGIWLLVGRATKKTRDCLWQKTPAFCRGPLRSVLSWGFTLALVGTGWFFFYTETLSQASAVISRLISSPVRLSLLYIKESLTQLGYTPEILLQHFFFILAAALVDWFSRRDGFGAWSKSLRSWQKIIFCYACLLSVIFFGASGSLPGVYFAF